MLTDNNDTVDLQSLCTVLVEDYQAKYIAATEQTLVNQSPLLLFHVPPGTGPLQEIEEDIVRQLDGVDYIRLGDHELPFSLRHVLHSDVHAFRRVPLYVDAQPGMDAVSIEEGCEQARKVVAGDIDSDSQTAESIELQTLVEELADAGAAAVELWNEFFILSGTIDLRIPIIPAKGYPIAGPYESVTFDGETYDFRFNCVLEGPCGYGMMRTPLYIDGSTLGLSGLPVDDGIALFEDLQSIKEGTNSLSEANEKLRDIVPTRG